MQRFFKVFVGGLVSATLALSVGACSGGEDDGMGDEEPDGSEGSGEGTGPNDNSGLTCGDIELVPMTDDPDEGYVDITDFCIAEINMYRARDDLAPFTINYAADRDNHRVVVNYW